MPTPIKIRRSYLKDTTYLSRLAQAVELDETQTDEWKQRAVQLLKELIDHLFKTRTPTQ